MRPLVDPPIACSTTCAFRNEASVSNSLGFGPFATAIAAATLPLASARRKRSACGAGIVALIGSARPSASVMHATVEAGPQPLALVMPDHHRPYRNNDRRQIGADRGHDLRRQGLVAAADHDHRVH